MMEKEFVILGYDDDDSVDGINKFENMVSKYIRSGFQVCTSGERLSKDGKVFIFVHLVRNTK